MIAAYWGKVNISYTINAETNQQKEKTIQRLLSLQITRTECTPEREYIVHVSYSLKNNLDSDVISKRASFDWHIWITMFNEMPNSNKMKKDVHNKDIKTHSSQEKISVKINWSH